MMQIIIPMSGIGKRFQDAGYSDPKFMLDIGQKKIIEHVVGMFSGEDKFIFICNKDHMEDDKFGIKKLLNNLNLENFEIVAIDPHKLGPVYAVLQAEKYITKDMPTIVNYCDFCCDWDYEEFKKFIEQNKCEGCIPAYKGFHPHTLYSNYYAYLKLNHENVLDDIKEKEPFTSNPREELASSGTYYFSSGALVISAFKKCIKEKLSVNNEYYISLVYKILLQDNLKVLGYELNHFMQWGTPQDYEEFKYYFNIFQDKDKKYSGSFDGNYLMSIAGKGQRFRDAGFRNEKPFLDINDTKLFKLASNDFPSKLPVKIILREDQEKEAKKYIEQDEVIVLDGLKNGQALSVYEGIKNANLNCDKPLHITACDSTAIFNKQAYLELINSEQFDVIVFGAENYPYSKRSPHSYGWIGVKNQSNIIEKISVKKPIGQNLSQPIVISDFTFKNADIFNTAVESMVNRNGKVNNEFYIDECINDCIELGYKVIYFPVDYYVSWGTPEEFKTFNYWQECFKSWEG